MRDEVHASELPGTVAWVLVRLGVVGDSGMVSVPRLLKVTIGEILDIAYLDSTQLSAFVADLGAFLEGRLRQIPTTGVAVPPRDVETPVVRRRRAGGATKAERRDALTRRILVHLLDHPGATIDEIATDLGEDVAEVTRAAKPVDWLILAPDELVEPGERAESDATAATRARARAAMQAAALITTPLSHQAYSTLVHEGRVSGPSVARIVQLFGSWTAACAEVGVRSGEPLRKVYTRSWSREDVLGHVERYLLSAEHRGASHRWDEWRASLGDAKVPSLGTVRNMLGSRWNDIRTEALRSLRAKRTRIPGGSGR